MGMGLLWGGELSICYFELRYACKASGREQSLLLLGVAAIKLYCISFTICYNELSSSVS